MCLVLSQKLILDSLTTRVLLARRARFKLAECTREIKVIVKLEVGVVSGTF